MSYIKNLSEPWILPLQITCNSPLCHQSNLLKIYHIFHLAIGKLIHSVHNGKLPQTFDDYFVPVASVYIHLTRTDTHGKHFLHWFSNKHGKDRSGIIDLRFGIQLIIHYSSCLLFRKCYQAHLISQYVEEDAPF